MSKRRKASKPPQRLTDFFPVGPHGGREDGAERGAAAIKQGEGDSGTTVRGAMEGIASLEERTPPSSPTTRSPAKTRQRTGDEGPSPTTHQAALQACRPQNPLHPTIDVFPATDQAISEATMKNMLISLRSTLYDDFSTMFNPLHDTVQTHSDKLHHIENKMADLYNAHNDLVDAYADQENELQRVQNKLADLEDRSRRNNIKFRGIPESVPPSDLTNFVQRLMKALIPSLTDIELCVDRAHRIPKPKFLPDTAPRDTLARVHYYHVKERVMRAAKQSPAVPEEFMGISLYTDISQHTAMNRKKLAPLTKLLRNHNLIYKWGFPTKLLITWNGKTYAIYSVEKGIQLFKQWGLLPPEGLPPTTPSPERLTTEWS